LTVEQVDYVVRKARYCFLQLKPVHNRARVLQLRKVAHGCSVFMLRWTSSVLLSSIHKIHVQSMLGDRVKRFSIGIQGCDRHGWSPVGGSQVSVRCPGLQRSHYQTPQMRHIDPRCSLDPTLLSTREFALSIRLGVLGETFLRSCHQAIRSMVPMPRKIAREPMMMLWVSEM
jgi:hypothetical protein